MKNIKTKLTALAAFALMSLSSLSAQVTPIELDIAEDLTNQATGAFNTIMPVVITIVGAGIVLSFARYLKRK